MTAGDVMTPDPETVGPRTTVSEAWELMRERGIRHLPVVEHDALVGMLSDRDLVGWEDTGAGTRPRSLPVIKVMTADALAVEPHTELAEVVALLLDERVGAVPVVRPGTRQVVGIVSYVDVLRAVHDLLEE
jgi:CBS domain-containing protein